MLGLVVSFREYVRDKFLLYSTVVYWSMCRKCSFAFLCQPSLLGIFFLRNRRGYFCLQFFFLLFHTAILVRRQFIFSFSYAGCDKVWTVQSFLVDRPQPLQFQYMPWNHLGFQTQKYHSPKPFVLFCKKKETTKPKRDSSADALWCTCPSSFTNGCKY